MKKIFALLFWLFLLPVIALADGSVTIIGQTTTITLHPTVDTNIYASGDLIGGKNTLSLAVRRNYGSGIINRIEVIDQSKNSANLDVVFFTTNPTNTTFTDNAAFDPHDTDSPFIICAANVTTHLAYADNSSSYSNQSCAFKLTEQSQKLYMAIVARSTPTFTAATDLWVRVSILQD